MVASRTNLSARERSVQDIADRRDRLPTGVEGQNVPTDFFIPGAGLEDVDRAIFELFEKRLKLEVTAKQETTVVPTIFAGGERFALIKKGMPPRDNAGAFVLPLVSIRRTGLEQSELGTIVGRGLGQDTGDLVVRRRLAARDPKYQSLLNKLRLVNQDNVATDENRLRTTNPVGSKPGKVASRRIQPRSFNTVTGNFLEPDLKKNIFEIITIPFPHFYTALYEVIFWTQYQQHMNRLIERFMTSYDAQGNQFRLLTNKGYWFVAYVDSDWSSEDNFSDYTGEERFVKYKFTIKVPAYLHAMERKGVGIPFRRFLSAPQISFQLLEGEAPIRDRDYPPVGSGDIDKFTLNDVTPLDRRGNPIEDERQFVEKVKILVHDPFTGEDVPTFRRVLSRNQRKGETVLSKRIIRKIDDINF